MRASPATTTRATPTAASAVAAQPRRATGPGPTPARPVRRRRRVRAPRWLLAPLVAVPLVARSTWPEPYPTVPLPPLTCQQPQRGLLTIVVDDRSTSTYSTDPDHRREPELRQVMQWLDDADCHPHDAGAVAQFDNVLPPLPPTDLDGGISTVLAALPDTAPPSTSTLAPPVRQATQWALARPDLEPVVLIATDGELNDFDAAFSALREFPGQVYVLALGGPLPSEWTPAAVVDGVTELRDQVAFGDVARSIAHLLQSASARRGGTTS